MAVPVAPQIRAHVLSEGKIGVYFHDVPGATSYHLYTGGTTRTAPETTGRNEQQTVTIDATGGTFTITYSGQETAAIDFDATAAAVQAALEALSNIAVGDVSVTLNGAVYTIEFTGLLARTDVAEVTCDGALLTGGAGTATPATTVSGVAASDTDFASGDVLTVAADTRCIVALRAANAEGEGPISNIVSMANRDYDNIFGDGM